VNSLISHARLLQLLSYCPDTGAFKRLVRTSNRVNVGDIAGNKMSTGYWAICVDGRQYLAHRLAWFYVHGFWPSDQIDHINGIRGDNRIANLREATRAQNQQNFRRARSDSSSGIIGVRADRKRGKWIAEIQVNGARKFLGRYQRKEDACSAYAAAKVQLHPFQTIFEGSP